MAAPRSISVLFDQIEAVTSTDAFWLLFPPRIRFWDHPGRNLW